MFADGDTKSMRETRMSLGIYLYAAGSFAAGLFDLLWHEFEAAHQPIQALGDNIPGRTLLACLAAICLITGGVAILWRRSTRIGAALLAAIYLIFAAFWLPRFYTAIHLLGFKLPLVFGLLTGVGQQAILVAAAIIVASPSRHPPLARWALGLSSIAFGMAHLTGVPQVAPMVPKWLPLGASFWAILTGIAFVAAGFAILTRLQDLLAARLLALMLFLFSVLVLARAPVARPHDHIAWGSNAYNLAAVGAVWIFAESVAARRRTHNMATALVPKQPAFAAQRGSSINMNRCANSLEPDYIKETDWQ